jgi:hypothetical protein
MKSKELLGVTYEPEHIHNFNRPLAATDAAHGYCCSLAVQVNIMSNLRVFRWVSFQVSY